MAKVAILMPYPQLRELAESLVQDVPHITPMCVEYVRPAQIRARVRELEEEGCELIVARGLHARIIQESVSIPVVEMRASTQELATIVLELKEQAAEDDQDYVKDYPRIGLIGFANMFNRTDRFKELFGVDLREYMVTDIDQYRDMADRAAADGCVGVIGGEMVCARARELGLACRFLSMGEESMRNVLSRADQMCYAIDLEKRNRSEMDTMLNYTFTGIMQADSGGVVRRVNRACYNLLEKLPGEIISREVTEILPNLSVETFQEVLVEGREVQAAVVNVNQKATLVNIVPVQVDGEIEGALFTFQEGKRIIEMDSRLRYELHQRGYVARHTFAGVVANSREMKALVALAKRIAQYSAPILLLGEMGAGKGILAQCIHNESLRRGHAFVPLDCSAWNPETMDNMLFGNYTIRKNSAPCMAEQAKDGTLYLSHVETLSLETQYKLLNLIRGRFLHNGPNQAESTDVRVIASADVNLAARVEKGEFRRDLYYALSVLSLELPPLRERSEDVADLFERQLKEWQEKYKRYVHLTEGGWRFVREYDWPGNLDQIDSLCERVVLLTEKRRIDEAFLKKQLEQVTPKLLPGTEKVVVYKDEKAAELSELLKKYGGNRDKVCAKLGISKTTLWRYMKKYGIGKDFSY